MRLQETKHLIIKLLQKRSDLPKRGRLTFAFFFEILYNICVNCHICYDIIKADDRVVISRLSEIAY